MLGYPSGIDLSSRTLQHLSGLLAGHRRQIGSQWRGQGGGEPRIIGNGAMSPEQSRTG
ncbi:hypothetical protein [Streptomyces sp. NPDC102282]|uniref:hypothetical protein n=1 Tax=Streptomyces sp. NPDC102282 TaxID=3366154 RepID=UPI0038149C61